MGKIDTRAPLIAGAAQETWRDGAPGPVAMLSEACAAALADAGGSTTAIGEIDALCVVRYVSASHADPSALVAAELGIDARTRIHTTIGGDTPQVAVGEIAGRIARGELDTALICGGEALATVSNHLRQGTDPGWDDPLPGSTPDEILGSEREANSPEEIAAGLLAPLMIYPLFEHALWATEGGGVADLRDRLGALQARFSSVAALNPHAWTPGPFDAEAIATPSPANRLVTLPYTKLMNSNIQVDQAAALFLCSAAKADSLGIPPDRRVFIHGSARATEPWMFSTRDDLGRSPAVASAVSAALSQSGATIDDIGLLDIYSCFPSAVRIAGREIGIDPLTDRREPTVTGGLAFAGGPGNAYVVNSIASMTERLRERPADSGLVTAVGWYLTKHAAGIYSASPPRSPFSGPADFGEAPAVRDVAPVEWEGEAKAETATVIHERDGSASLGILTALLPDGRRVMRSTTEESVLNSFPDRPVTGMRAEIRAGGFDLP